MKIDGRAIAEKIYDDLRVRVGVLHKKSITPHLAVILVGDDPSSKAYVLQKQIKAKHIDARVTVFRFDQNVSELTLVDKIKKLNNDPKIHGIIVQRPLPSHINNETIDSKTDPKKDVDGFLPTSPFKPPVALAVVRILQEVYALSSRRSANWRGGEISGPREKLQRFLTHKGFEMTDAFLTWLQQQNIVVLGQGKTGGGPTIRYLQELGCNLTIIRSKTENKEGLTRQADIVISAVGKPEVLRPEMLKKNVILISIGMHKEDDDKLHGDYDEEKIKNIASFYTSSPGGVGPVNVAMLLANLLQATEAN